MSGYWGQPADRNGEGYPLQRWKVRKWPGTKLTTIWEVFDPNGEFSGAFEDWDEAITWATSVATRLEYWLAHQ